MDAKKKIAIALMSGGLDSILAAKIIADLGRFLVVGYHFHHPFLQKASQVGITAVESQARSIGIPLIIDSDYTGFIEMTKNPIYGRGKGANPCRDCRIFILKRANRILKALGGDFLVSGEVVGQRPMSQMKNWLLMIEKEAGVSGILLRPLSAKILNPSLPEKEGWISPQELYDFSGRSRKDQIVLAQKMEISEYPTPAGGCLLTEKSFSTRYFDLIKHCPKFGLDELKTLKLGRHLRLPSGIKVIIARDKIESEIIYAYIGISWVMTTSNIPGPYALLDREPDSAEILEIGALIASYSKARCEKSVEILIFPPKGVQKTESVKPADKAEYSNYLL
ncbi:hypothetical protein KAH81_01935 [bacterium]|nr:hypothetical protein [bacterium]